MKAEDLLNQDPWDQPAPFYTHNLPLFPTEALSPWMRGYVGAESISLQTPPELVGNLALSCCAAAVARKIRVQVRPDWQEPLNIFTVTVLPPGTRKTAAFADATAPVSEHERRASREAEPFIRRAEAQLRVLEQRLALAEKKAASAKPEEREQCMRDVEEAADAVLTFEVPARPRMIADDCTSERLGTLLRDHGGRMAVLSPEGDVFEIMAGRYSSGGTPNFAVYLKGHAGDTHRVDRVKRAPEYIEKPALTIGLAVQPDVLRCLVDKPGFRGRGLLGRFLYSVPAHPLGHRHNDPPPVPGHVRGAYRKALLDLLELPANQDEEGNQIPFIVHFDEAAHLRMLDFLAEIEPTLAQFGELGQMTDWGGKYAGAVVRLAGILHLTDRPTSPAPWDEALELETLERAIRLGKYYLAHAKAAYAEMGADPVVEDARHLLGWIERSGVSSFSKRDLFEGVKGRFKRVAALDPPLALLVEHAYVRLRPQERKPGPGRSPSEVFEVNPSLLGNSANTANSARAVPDEPAYSEGPELDSANIANSANGPEGLVDGISPSVSPCEDGTPTRLSSAALSHYSHNSQNTDDPQTPGTTGSPLVESVPPCRACGSLTLWRSIEGQIACAECSPPASAAILAEWVHLKFPPDEREERDEVPL